MAAKKRISGTCSARKLQEMRCGPCTRQDFRAGWNRPQAVVRHDITGQADDLRGVAYGRLRITRAA